MHVRLVEDTCKGRWPQLKNQLTNITVLSVSQYISERLPLQNIQLYDPYKFDRTVVSGRYAHSDAPLKVGIIGRISKTKGINIIIDLLELIKFNGKEEQFMFYFYGEITGDIDYSTYERIVAFQNIRLITFEPDKEKMYKSIDCILHASSAEPLGRIYLEAIDFFKPLIGIKKGGIGEISGLLNYDNLMVSGNRENLHKELFEKLMIIKQSYYKIEQDLLRVKNDASELFDCLKYTAAIDNLIN
ncbi:MAG TPA: glycosyltransferase [Flavitalea sp.]|nr:glycosyltransferase [Flavitalea sp.]